MTCHRCRKTIDERDVRCPYCGLANAGANGLYQTSVVRIASGAADLVYRSVDEVPAPLRQKLLASTNSSNSATILIADRKGRKEIDKAMRKLPATSQRRSCSPWVFWWFRWRHLCCTVAGNVPVGRWEIGNLAGRCANSVL